jgi:hypothetical protein
MRLSIISCLVTLWFSSVAIAEDQLVSKIVDRPLPDEVSFNAHIRPLMSNTCFLCHGPDDHDNESGYRIDSYEEATATLPSDDDLVGIKPGDPDASEVYLRIIGASDGEQMPPEDFRHQLSSYDRALIEKWIRQGAKYQQHWSYTPIQSPAIPTPAKHRDEIANPIDAFVLSRLEENGIEPTELADRATLLRRLSLDIIGLPPTPDEVKHFVNNEDENAYQQEVDRLLASPHYGERMASNWLDIVRYADTVGFHGDQNQRIFTYRDYVIDAFNNNKPFDQFTTEQIAGDLLADSESGGPTDEQLTATGLLRLNMMTREGGAQPGEYLAKYKADRVRMLGTAFLGSTLACCECHNHKYDPFSAKDFYSLGAFFDDLQQWGVYTSYPYSPNPDLNGFSNHFPFPPELRLESPSLLAEMAVLQSERDTKLASAVGMSTLESEEFLSWHDSTRDFIASHPSGWYTPAITSVSTDKETKYEILEDRGVLLDGESSPAEKITVATKVEMPILANAIRLEILPDDLHGGNVGRGEDGRFQLSIKAMVGKDTEVPIAWGEADRRTPATYHSGAEPLTLDEQWKSGPAVWQLPSDETKIQHTAVFHFAEPLQLKQDDQLTIEITSGDVGKFRVSMTPMGQPIAGHPAATDDLVLAINDEEPTLRQRESLLSLYHRSTVPFEQQSPISKFYRDRLLELRTGLAMTMVAQTVQPEDYPVSKVLPRGNWQDDTGELAPPAFPHFLPQPKQESGRRLTRLDLADWLTAPENPLTSRHFVNRTWRRFFGSGLSGVLSDLGNQGEWPSHPLLLDWLASEFVSSGWDVKELVRTIVHSRTYRQASAVRDDLKVVDPYNRLLAQGSARRLEAEAIRDNALAISGLLRTDYIGGPSVFPYQPDGHYKNIQFPWRKYVSNTDFRQYRRGVYMHWQRSFLHPMLVNFDAPPRDECTADRVQSNSPQQALTLLNDPVFVEASHAMARKLLREHPESSFSDLLDVAFLTAVARSPTFEEQAALEGLYERQWNHFKDHPQDAEKYGSVGNQKNLQHTAKVAALGQVCRVVLNLHETITRY